MNTRTLTRILHVEDEPDIRAVARLALERVGGYIVESCSSGAEALEKVSAFKPDLLLLDVMMPVMDGPTTLAELRRIQGLEETPVIFMTAKIMAAERQIYGKIGAIDVIAKPFDPMTLASQIQDIWESRDG